MFVLDNIEAKKLLDEEIVEQVQNGNNELFGILIERYENKILRYAQKFLFNHENAEDLMQEIFIKAYTNIESFNLQMKFSPWLYRIAHNYFLNEIKKKSRRPFLYYIDTDMIFPKLFSKESSDTEILNNELQTMMTSCINKINPKYREILILFFYEELSYKEISDVLRISVSAVGVRLNRAKSALKKILKL